MPRKTETKKTRDSSAFFSASETAVYYDNDRVTQVHINLRRWFKIPQMIVEIEAIRTCQSRTTNISQRSESKLINIIHVHSITTEQA